MEERIVDLIETIENLAPEAWEVLVRQQVIEGVMQIATAVLLFTVVGTFAVWYDDDDGFEWAVGFVAGGIALVLIFFGIMNLANPEFYAIKELMPR